MGEAIKFWFDIAALVIAGIASSLIAIILRKLHLIDKHVTDIALLKSKLGEHEKEINRMRSRMEVKLGLTPHPRKVNRILEDDDT